MSEIKLHETLNAAIWAKEFCKRWPSALCAIPGKEGIQGGEEFEATMVGWFANAIMAGVDSVIAERDALKEGQIDAIRAALEAAAEVCAGIRQRISNGPMPEGARFDYEQAIRALDPAAIAAKLKGDGDDR